MNEGIMVVCNLSNSNVQRILKKSLERWKIYSAHKLNKKRDERKALYLYNVRLKQKVLNSLLKNCIDAKKARAFCNNLLTDPGFQKAQNFARRRILKRVYHVWSIYASNQRRRKALTSSIFEFRNEVFLRKYIKYWKVVRLEKKRKVELEIKAMEFYRYNKLRKFLGLWLEARNHRLLENTEWENAIVHWHRKLLRKIWHAWIKYCNIKIERANRIEEIREFYEKKLLEKSLKSLSSNVNTTIAKRRNLEKATNYYTNKLSNRIFQAWTNYHREKKRFESKISIQRGKIEISSKQNVLKQLRLYVWRKKCFRRKKNVSISHYSRKLATKTIRLLKKYLRYREEKARRLRYLKCGISEISLNLLRVHVDKWRIAVVCIAQERQKMYRAEEHWRSHQIQYYFFIWKQYSESYKLKAKRKDGLNEIGKTVLLEKYTNLWLKRYEVIAKIRLKETLALSINAKKLQSRLFRSWKRYIDEKIVRKIEIDEATKFHRKLLLREGLKETLKLCLYKIGSRYEKRLRCAKKNSIEDFDITRKFFTKWLALVSPDDNGKTRNHVTFVTQRKTDNCTPISTRLVLPEYMLNNTRIENHDNDFHGEKAFEETLNRDELEKTYLSSGISRYPTLESFRSTSDNTKNAFTKMYRIRKSVPNSLNHFHNFSFG